MKNINLIFLSLIILFCMSCSKENVNSNVALSADALKSQALVEKYHLQIAKNDGTIPNQSFKTLDEFELFLQSHSQKVTASNISSAALKSTSGTSEKTTFDVYGSGSSTWYFGGGANRSEMHFPAFDGTIYLAYLSLGWQSTGWADSWLHNAYYTNTEYGNGVYYTWSQTETSATSNSTTVTTAGTYATTYNVGGVYYTYNYVYNLNASWNPDGTISAWLSYAP